MNSEQPLDPRVVAEINVILERYDDSKLPRPIVITSTDQQYQDYSDPGDIYFVCLEPPTYRQILKGLLVVMATGVITTFLINRSRKSS